MDRDEAWRVGDERRREAQEALTSCGIESVALCALCIASGSREPVGKESIIIVAVPQHGDPDRDAIVAVVDDGGNPKACSVRPMGRSKAEELRLLVIGVVKGNSPKKRSRKGRGDQYGVD